MKILFIRSRDNVVFSHKIVSYDIEENKIFDVCDIEQVYDLCKLYDWVFVLHDRERIEAIQGIRKLIKVACWSLEDPYELEQDFEICKQYDYVFTVDSGAVNVRQIFTKQPISPLPLAVNTKSYFPEKSGDEYLSDILIVGVAFPKRLETVHAIIDLVTEKKLNLKIIGWWWERLNNKNIEKAYVDKGIFEPSVIRQFYNGAKIVLEVNRDLYSGKMFVDAHTPGRAYNSLACSAFTISDERQDTRNMFSKEELVVFDDFNDLNKKISYYLDNKKEREEIAYKGYQRVIKDHTINTRMIQMVEILSSR